MSIRHNNKTIAGGYSPTSYRYVGEIFQSALPITDPKVHALDGSTITITEGYAQFIQHLNNLVLTYPQLACTEEEWQAIKTASKLGQCGKFVIDNEAGTIRLPAIININGLTDLSKAGLIKDESLPNITGAFDTADRRAHPRCSGAFYSTTTTDYGRYTRQLDVTSNESFGFNASHSSSTYKNNAPVQQEAVQYPYYIVLATGVVQNITYYEDLKVNNTNSYGDSKYIKGKVNNLSWLKSEGQWNDGETYKGLYEWAVNQMNNNVEGFKGPTGYAFSTEGYVVWCTTEKPSVGTLIYGYTSSHVNCGTVTSVDTTNNTITVHDFISNIDKTISRNKSIDLNSEAWFGDYDFIIDTENKRFRLPLKNRTEKNIDWSSENNYTNYGATEFAPYDGFVKFESLVIAYESGSTAADIDINGTIKGVPVYICKAHSSNNLPGNDFESQNHNAQLVPIKAGEPFRLFTAYSTGNTRVHSWCLLFYSLKNEGNLYYYAGDTLKNIDLINIGKLSTQLVNKIDTDLSNISTSSKETITHWGFPSNKYIDLTLNAPGASYTAPADGWASAFDFVVQKDSLLAIYIPSKIGIGQRMARPTTQSYANVMIPCSKGDTFKLDYGDQAGNTNTPKLRFYYSVGAAPTA